MKCLAEFVEAAIEVVAHDADALSRSAGDFLGAQAFVVNQFDGAALARLQGSENLVHQDAALGSEVPVFMGTQPEDVVFEGIRIEEAACNLRTTTVEGAMVREHQEPRFECSLLGVELMDGAEHIEKDLLYGVLRLRVVL